MLIQTVSSFTHCFSCRSFNASSEALAAAASLSSSRVSISIPDGVRKENDRGKTLAAGWPWVEGSTRRFGGLQIADCILRIEQQRQRGGRTRFFAFSSSFNLQFAICNLQSIMPWKET